MKKFVFIVFLPGSAGNFISRSLNLLNNFHAWTDGDSKMPDTIDEKLNLLSYLPVENFNKNSKNQNWIHFERQLVRYHYTRPHWDIPDNGTAIWIDHPREDQSWCDELVGDDDKKFVFFIDPYEIFDWVEANAYWKNSALTKKWIDRGISTAQDKNLYQINLKNIVDSKEGYFKEIEKICNIIGHSLTDEERQAQSILYDQWQTTTVKYSEIEKIKETMSKDEHYLRGLEGLNDPR